jgi:hypothetical protein
MQDSSTLEYNTDSLAGTFDRLKSIVAWLEAPGAGAQARSVTVRPEIAGRFIQRTFSRLFERLVDELATRAIERAGIPGRWERITASELICEVMTDRSIRKGLLSTAGRRSRRDLIAQSLKSGRLEFAILLLPCRAPSRLKHCGVLPDLGEAYTLVLLAALARAGEEVQMRMRAACAEVVQHVARGDIASVFEQSAEPPPLARNTVMEDALVFARQHCGDEQAYVVRRKKLVGSVQALRGIVVKDSRRFGEFLNRLCERNIAFDAFLAFFEAGILPVTVLGVQDAGRYPCFGGIPDETVSNYRALLLDYIRFLDLPERNFRLLSYGEIVDGIRGSARYAQMAFFQSRLACYTGAIRENLDRLHAAPSREAFHAIVRAMEGGPQLSALFEPLLLSLPQAGLETAEEDSEHAKLHFYAKTLSEVYCRSREAAREDLRRRIIADTLQGTAEYCAAYEANTGSKNPSGFDDVASILPNALRMSIHRKDEAAGHFSVSVSPSFRRTPWHGTVALHPGSSDEKLRLSVDLVGDLKSAGYVGVFISEAHRHPEFSWLQSYTAARQAVFYIAPSVLGEASNHEARIAALSQRELESHP